MKTLSMEKLADIVKTNRGVKEYNQDELSKLTGINRSLISRIERKDFVPSIQQIESLAETLAFDITDLLIEKKNTNTFVALRSETLNDSEKKGVDQLFTMMLSLRQQILLRSKFENEGKN